MKAEYLSILFIAGFLFIGCGGESPEAEEQTDVDETTEEITEGIIEEVPDEMLVEEGDCQTQFTAYLDDPDTENPTNIRAKPNGKVVMKLEPGDYFLTVTEAQDGWFKLRNPVEGMEDIYEIPGEVGWIHGSVISVSTRNYDGSSIKLYKTASEDDEVVGTIDQESYGLHLKDICGDWVQVEWSTNGTKIVGWTKAHLLCGNPVTTCS